MTEMLILSLVLNLCRRISSKKNAAGETKEQNELDMKSLQILRAMLYNAIIKLPDNWKGKSNSVVHRSANVSLSLLQRIDFK